MAEHAHTTTDVNRLSRAQLADAIEAAIALLDDLDQDADLEDGADLEDDTDTHESDTLDEHGEEDRSDREEDLGWAENIAQLALGVGHGDGDETAVERAGAGFVRSGLDDAEDDGTAEPSLGSPERQPTGWGPYGFNIDHRSSQVAWGVGSTDEREEDAGDQGEEENEHGCDLGGSDNGIGDQHGLDSDREPSLGALTWAAGGGNQERWGATGTSDVEADAGDEGEARADEDGDGEFSGGSVLNADEPSWAAAGSR